MPNSAGVALQSKLGGEANATLEIRGDEALSDEELVARYIVRDPHELGPDTAKIAWGVSVWALIGYMRGEANSVADTAEAYELPEIAVRAALAYDELGCAIIDARLLLNDAAFE